jgi:hypothetical protein
MKRRLFTLLAALATMLGVGLAAVPTASAVTAAPMGPHWQKQAATRYIYAHVSSSVDLNRYPVITNMNTWNSYLAVNSVPLRFSNVGSCTGKSPCFEIMMSWKAQGISGDTGLITSGGYLVDISTVNLYYNNDVNPYDWRVHLGMHELGHALGLAHNTIPNSVMNVDWNQSPIGTTPKAEESLALINTYR